MMTKVKTTCFINHSNCEDTDLMSLTLWRPG